MNETTTTFGGAVNGVRKSIKDVAATLKNLRDQHSGEMRPSDSKEDFPEVMANLTLAYRHLEDASMRLGKVLQAVDGGESVYDKETTVGVCGNNDKGTAIGSAQQQ